MQNPWFEMRKQVKQTLDELSKSIIGLQNHVEAMERGWNEAGRMLNTDSTNIFLRLKSLREQFVEVKEVLGPSLCPECGGFTEADGEPVTYGGPGDWAQFDISDTWCIGETNFYVADGDGYLEVKRDGEGTSCGWGKRERTLRASGGW